MSVSYFNAPIQIPNAKSLSLADADNSATLQLKPNDVTTSYTIEFPSSLGNNNQVLSITSNVGGKAALDWSDINVSSLPADDITTGDNDVLITTTSGNVRLNTATDFLAIQYNASNVVLLEDANTVNITPTTQSTSTTTGALVVRGGVGIASNLYVGGNVVVTEATTLSSTLDVTGATTLSSTLDVTGVTNLNDTTTSTSSTTGALIVDGGVGIASNLYVGGNVVVTEATTLSSTLNVTGATTLSSTLDVTGVTTLTDNVTASANLSVSKKFIVGVDTFTDLSSLDTTRTNLFNGSNAASVKHLDLNTASTLYGNVDAGVVGETLNLFYDNDLSGSANIDFTTNGLYAGSGIAQYLVFTNSGQSASLIYVGSAWRIINTGATVA